MDLIFNFISLFLIMRLNLGDVAFFHLQTLHLFDITQE